MLLNYITVRPLLSGHQLSGYLYKKKHCLALDIFGALFRSSHLCCIKRMCPQKKWPALKIMKFKACAYDHCIIQLTMHD